MQDDAQELNTCSSHCGCEDSDSQLTQSGEQANESEKQVLSYSDLFQDYPATLDLISKSSLDAQPSQIVQRMVPAILDRESIVVAQERAIYEVHGIILALNASMGSDERAMFIVPSDSDTESVADACQELAIKNAVRITNAESSKSAATEARYVIGTTDSLLTFAAEADQIFSRIVIIGYEPGIYPLPSSDLETLLTSLTSNWKEKSATEDSQQIIWVSKAIPLMMTALVNNFIRKSPHREINPAEEKDRELEHLYYELSRDLLAKPNALISLIESMGRPSSLIYTNSPSDADLVEALLLRKGIPCRKLVGHVPDKAVSSAMNEVYEDSIRALIATDVSARTMPVEDFEVIFHYSTPEAPEIYMNRIGHASQDCKLTKVISLVGSVDLGNFHYLTKVAEFIFEKRELPSSEDLAKVQLARLIEKAQASAADQPETMLKLARELLSHQEVESVVSYLLNLALTESSSSSHASGRRERGTERQRDGAFREGGSRDGNSRNDRQDRSRRGGRDQGSRDSRGSNEEWRGADRSRSRNGDSSRGGYGDGEHGSDAPPRGRGSRDRNPRDAHNDQRESSPRGANSRGRSDRDADSAGNESSERRRPERAPYVPPKKEVRIYIGSSLNQESLNDLLGNGSNNFQPTRSIHRDTYTFADFHEEIADSVLTHLNSATGETGEPLVVRKATMLSVPQPQPKVAPAAEVIGDSPDARSDASEGAMANDQDMA